MPDYNIYIHDLSGGQEDSSTFAKAWQGSQSPQTKAWQGGNGEDGSNALNGTPVPKIVSFEALAKVVQSHPVVATVAAAYAAAKTITYTEIKIREAIESWAVVETGNYDQMVALQNKQTTANLFFHPVSSILSALRTKHQVKYDNLRQEQERNLLGDAFVNNVARRV